MAEPIREDLSVQQERAFLVKLITPGMMYDARRPLDELEALAGAAGAIVVDGFIQKRREPSGKTYLGKGKVEELRERADASEANIIIFDDDLSPAQIRVLEKMTERKIIDRSELILDIFAARAQTLEAKLQVELAQLEYTSPRLRGMWTHLERIAGAGGGTGVGSVGGIGTRGPGERQIEIDRRIVADRVSHLKREIEKIDKRKTQEVLARSDEFTVSLVGYTNAGKSTLMNTVTESEQMVADMLFATLDTRTTRWNLAPGRHVLLSDTVGFVRNLPHKLVASFRATLEQTIHANLLLHVIDTTARDVLLQVDAVTQVLDELGVEDVPMIAVFNKVDALEDDSILSVLENRMPRSITISAKTGRGIDQMIELILAEMEKHALRVTLRIPLANGRALAEIDRMGDIINRSYEGNFSDIDMNIDRTQLNQLLGRNPDLRVLAPEWYNRSEY